MTGTSARNNYGIFKTKKAKILANKYSLDLHEKSIYIFDENDLVKLSDVKHLIDNLWIDHLLSSDLIPKPIPATRNQYFEIITFYKNIIPEIGLLNHMNHYIE